MRFGSRAATSSRSSWTSSSASTGPPPSVVVALSEVALGFVIRHRARLWPESPVVFSSVAPDSMAEVHVPAWSTGIYEGVDAAGTLDLIARLQPEVRRIVIVTGVSEQDATVLASVLGRRRASAPGSTSPFDGEPRSRGFARKWSPPLRYRASLHDPCIATRNGGMWTPRDFLERLSAMSSVPIYGLYSTYLGHGIVGGALHDFESEGRETGELVLRVLEGASPSSIPPRTGSRPLLAVDARELRRFGIPVGRAPSGGRAALLHASRSGCTIAGASSPWRSRSRSRRR